MGIFYIPLNYRLSMANRVNTLFVVLLMVLGAFVSGLYITPHSTQNELNEKATVPFFGGNNSSVNEWVQAWPVGSNFTSDSVINVTWSAGDLATNITYNVTLDIYAHNATSNTTYIIHNYFTVFNATSNASGGNWILPNATLSAGCYYGSVRLNDYNDSMNFDDDGFDLGINANCSGGSESSVNAHSAAGTDNTGFACPDGHLKVAVEATDNVTGAAIEIWDCILPGDEDLPPVDSPPLLPSIGVFGTLIASVFAVFIVAIRRDEE